MADQVAGRSAWDRFVDDAARWVRPEEVADRSEVTLSSMVKMLFRHPSLRAMGWFRVSEVALALGVPAVPSLLQRRIMRLYGLELAPGRPVAGGLYVAHPVGCTLIADSIGANVSVMGAVTFGRTNEARWPVIGDGVLVGAGARVLGALTVGDRAIVGANAVVVRDVEPDTTVVGVPARRIAAE